MLEVVEVDGHGLGEGEHRAACRKLGVSRETIRVAIDRLVKEGLVYKLKGSGTYFHREKVMTRDLNTDDALYKIGLILQGQDTSANSGLIEGVPQRPEHRSR